MAAHAVGTRVRFSVKQYSRIFYWPLLSQIVILLHFLGFSISIYVLVLRKKVFGYYLVVRDAPFPSWSLQVTCINLSTIYQSRSFPTWDFRFPMTIFIFLRFAWIHGVVYGALKFIKFFLTLCCRRINKYDFHIKSIPWGLNTSILPDSL